MATISDQQRRDEIIRRTLMGLEDDLEDLREELIDALTRYEQTLRRLTSQTPRWLQIPAAQLRQIFHFPADGVAPEAMLGPRAVALAAGRVEGFVRRWFGEADAPRTDLDDDALVAFLDDRAAVVAYLDEVRAEADALRDEAAATLEAWEEGIFGQLDRRRQTDQEAIEELVSEGEIRRGQSARQELADLWEEQRRRSAQLAECWDGLLAHVDEGHRRVDEGLGELGELVRRATAGLAGAHPALADALAQADADAPADTGDASATEPPAPAVDDADAPTAVAPATEPPSTDDAGPTQAPADAAPVHDAPVDEAPAATAPIAAPAADEVGPTAPVDEATAPTEPAPAATDTAADTDAVDAAGQTAPASTIPPGIVPLDEPSSEPEIGGIESSSVTDYSEPMVAPPRPTTPQAGARRAPRRSEASTDADAPDTDAAEAADDAEQPDESAAAISAPCFRIRSAWHPVSGRELALTLLPPLGFLGAMATLSILYLTGTNPELNPMTAWDWTPAALAVAAGWLVLIPAGLRWRPVWRGWRLSIRRRSDVRDDARLELDTRRLRVGRISVPRRRLRGGEVARWESPLDDARGWLLSIYPTGQPPLEFAAPATDDLAWVESSTELVDVPYDAWQLDPRTFADLRSRLEPRRPG